MMRGQSGAESNEGRGTRSIVRIAIGGIAVGVAVMIVAVAIVTGFREEIKNKVVGFEADVRITHVDNDRASEPVPLTRDTTLMAQVRTVPGVRHVQVFATKAGIIRTDADMEGAVVKGIGSDFDWSFFERHMVQGTTFVVSDTGRSNSVVISEQTANRLHLALGDRMQIYFLQGRAQRARALNIVGIFRTGLEEMDRLYILADIGHVQRLNDWDSTQVAGYEVSVDDFSQVDVQADAINHHLPYDHFTETIKELQPQMFDWLELQDVNVQVIIVLMLIVAGFNMISALLIMIIERVNMIGLLKTMGMSNGNIQLIFLQNGLYLTAIGLLWGNIIGIGACLVQHYTGIVTLSEENYYMAVVPINLDLWAIALLNVGSLGCCLVMLLLPSFLVSRISPLTAVRYA